MGLSAMGIGEDGARLAAMGIGKDGARLASVEIGEDGVGHCAILKAYNYS